MTKHLQHNLPTLLVGDEVEILDPEWEGHWGEVTRIVREDDEYHVSKGSIGDITLMFDRYALAIRRKT